MKKQQEKTVLSSRQMNQIDHLSFQILVEAGIKPRTIALTLEKEGTSNYALLKRFVPLEAKKLWQAATRGL